MKLRAKENKTTYILVLDPRILQTMPEKRIPVTRFSHIIPTNV